MQIPVHLKQYIAPLEPIPTHLKPSGKLATSPKCILFDIYGTLIISASGDIRPAEKDSKGHALIHRLLQKYAIDIQPENLLKNLFSAIKKVHAELKGQGVEFPEVEIDRIWTGVLNIKDPDRIRSFAVEFEIITNPVYPMPHLAELIAACSKKQLCMGIISNAQFYTPLLFKWFLGRPLPELGVNPKLIFYSYQYGQAKPSLFLYEKAQEQMDRFDIDSSEVIYVGNDMLNDVYPAQAMGFKTALFAGDKRSLRLREDDERLCGLKSDLVITDLIQLLDIV